MISIREVSCVSETDNILSNLSVELDYRRVAIIGANGSGKSTLARLLNGLVLPDSGSVLIDGLDTRKDTKRVRRKVGFVFQNPDLQFVFPTVEEDLLFGLKNLGLSSVEQTDRMNGILDRFSLHHLKHRSVHKLSGGEKQLLCIAGVLVMQPELIVFDEPTTLLDLRNRTLINQIILSLDSRVVVITHDLEFARQFDCVVCVHNGTLLEVGEPLSVVETYLDLVRLEIQSVSGVEI